MTRPPAQRHSKREPGSWRVRCAHALSKSFRILPTVLSGQGGGVAGDRAAGWLRQGPRKLNLSASRFWPVVGDAKPPPGKLSAKEDAAGQFTGSLRQGRQGLRPFVAVASFNPGMQRRREE